MFGLVWLGLAAALAAISVLGALVTPFRAYAITQCKKDGDLTKHDFVEKLVGPLYTFAVLATVFGGICHAFRIGSLTAGTLSGGLGIAYLVAAASAIVGGLAVWGVLGSKDSATLVELESKDSEDIARNLFGNVGITSCLVVGCVSATVMLIENSAAIAQSPLLIITAVAAAIGYACVISNVIDLACKGMVLAAKDKHPVLADCIVSELATGKGGAVCH